MADKVSEAFEKGREGKPLGQATPADGLVALLTFGFVNTVSQPTQAEKDAYEAGKASQGKS